MEEMKPQTHIKASLKDIFLQLLAIVTLYGSAVGFVTLLFQFTNVRFPDALDYYSFSNAYRSIRFAVSSLIIIFPVYVWVVRFLERSYKQEPERKAIRIRKWLVYFTLFAAGLIIMGDLVALVNSFLSGELTARFIFKVLSIFLVAGAIFWYYYWDMKEKEPPGGVQIFQWGVVGAVCVGIAAAFFVVGSPQQERLRRFDDERVSDLQNIQWQIVNYWQSKGALPQRLLDLNDPISGFNEPADPVTGAFYVYEVRGEYQFVLCADFTLESRTSSKEIQPLARGIEENWEHGPGRACFERFIDPDLYPVRPDLGKPVLIR